MYDGDSGWRWTEKELWLPGVTENTEGYFSRDRIEIYGRNGFV